MFSRVLSAFIVRRFSWSVPLSSITTTSWGSVGLLGFLFFVGSLGAFGGA